jgi:hypothetical protein
MKKCCNCSKYAPHVHPERLTRVPSEKSIFVCEDGDISFAPPSFIKQVLEVMRNDTKIGRIWFMQSKNPACFNQYLQLLPENTYLVSTLETNRDEGYENMSKAPLPSIRYRDFLSLDWEKKIVTVEPILAFDLGPFVEQIMNINPKAVFVGYNSAPKEVRLPEPSMEQTWELINQLRASGLRVYEKDLRIGLFENTLTEILCHNFTSCLNWYNSPFCAC